MAATTWVTKDQPKFASIRLIGLVGSHTIILLLQLGLWLRVQVLLWVLALLQIMSVKLKFLLVLPVLPILLLTLCPLS